MKNVTAVICELNPLHKGHEYLLNRAREESDVLLLIQSGAFVERGIPSLYDPYTRAEVALRCGADLVVELPYPYSSAGTETFARGGVVIAAALGADRLVFGSESGDFSLVEKVAKIKPSIAFRDTMRKIEKEARSNGSAAIFHETLAAFGVTEPLGANDKLGAEYIRFGREMGINNFTLVKRMEAKSASELREIIADQGIEACREWIPAPAYEVFARSEECMKARYNGILFDYCRIYAPQSENELVRYAASVAYDSKTAEEFVRNLPTKKYTLARLRREILASLLGCEASPEANPDFTRLLAANEIGCAYLAEQKKALTIEIVTKPADAKSEQYRVTTKADELYALLMKKRGGEQYRQKPIIFK